MTKSPRAARRVGDGHVAGSVDVDQDGLVIRLPDPRVLRLVARSVLLAAAILSFSWLQIASRDGAEDDLYSSRATSDGAADTVFVPMAFRDMRRQGMLKPGDRAVYLGFRPSPRLVRFLKQSNVDVVMDLTSEESKVMLPDRSIDFIFVASGFGNFDFGISDRVLKVGGVAASRLGAEVFHLPANYRVVYIRQFGSTIVGVRKISHAIHNAGDFGGIRAGRKLLAVPEAMKMALDGLEDVLLEPPTSRRRRSGENWKSTRYLPDLMGDSLEGYPRRVFVDVGTPGQSGNEQWFKKHYPTRNQKFDIIRLDVVVGGNVAARGMSEWLGSNVREDEYVVMKAEAGVVEEMVKGRAIGLVDELFMECNNQWQKGSKELNENTRAYWECLSLYGKLKDEGIAVHQWWGF